MDDRTKAEWLESLKDEEIYFLINALLEEAQFRELPVYFETEDDYEDDLPLFSS